MTATTATTVKKTTRARKTTASLDEKLQESLLPTTKELQTQETFFDELVTTITTAKTAFLTLQKQIVETKMLWEKDQQEHIASLQDKNQQEEINRKREQEMYEYETAKKRRQEEDAFVGKKSTWEKELYSQKEIIGEERKELAMLRKQVEGFEADKQKAIKEATVMLQKDLEGTFATEKKLKDQEVKAEKDMLALKLANLIQENTRQAKEIETLKLSLEQATTQLKDVAVKVIESANPSKQPVSQEN